MKRITIVFGMLVVLSLLFSSMGFCGDRTTTGTIEAIDPALLHRESQSFDQEPTTYTLTVRFGLQNSLERVKQVQEWLGKFAQLADQRAGLAEKPVNPDSLWPDWETYALGFGNWTRAIEGTLRKQELLIVRLQYELARKQLQDGEINEADLKAAREILNQREKDFIGYFKEFSIAD